MGALLEAALPEVSCVRLQALLREQYGLEGRLSALSGERDRNYLLRNETAAFAVRVINPEETPAVSDFQSQALLHLAREAPELPVPRVVPPIDGGAEARWALEDGRPCRVRVLTYLEGRPLPSTGGDGRSGAGQVAAVGRCLALLDRGLAGFRHAAEGHRLLWDIQHAADLRGLVADVPDAPDRALAHAVLDRFEAHVLPVADRLRHQVIHNDFNPHNILADATRDDVIAGIIDFGDMVRAPMVQDLATAAAYQIPAGGHALAGPIGLAAAFHGVVPLQGEEVAVLVDLVATRLVATVVISGWRARRQPENAGYLLRNYPRSIDALRRVSAIERGAATAMLWEGLSR